MRPVQETVTGTGFSPWIRLDRRARTLNTLMVTRLLSGTATWNLQVTENDPPSPLSFTPFVDPSMNALTASAWVVWNGYVSASCRLDVTAGGTGGVQITVLQGGP